MEINKDEMKSLLKEIMDENEAKDEKQPEKKADTNKEEPNVEVDLAKATEEAAKRVTEMIAAQLGGDDSDAESIKNKLYTQDEGIKAKKYPEVKELEDMSDDDKIATYYKALFTPNKGVQEQTMLKALSEGTAEDGGHLVPTPLHNEVYRILDDKAIMRQIATVLTMTSKTLEIPFINERPAVYFVGENETSTTTTVGFDDQTLTARKLIARLAMSQELQDDAIVAMVPLVNEMFAEAIAAKEDEVFFSGDGSGKPKGIDEETISSGDVGSTFSFDDVLNLINAPAQSIRNNPNTVLVGHKNVINKMKKIKDDNGAYIWMGRNTPLNGRPENTVMGYEVYEQNDLSEDELYFGNFKQYYIGDRKRLSVDTSTTANNAWTKHQVEVKAVERIDGRTGLTDAFAKLTGISSAS
jgi:HK97 family phage major capsid protein